MPVSNIAAVTLAGLGIVMGAALFIPNISATKKDAYEQGRQAGITERAIALVCEPTTNTNGDSRLVVSFENGDARIFVKNPRLILNAYMPIAQAKTREQENLTSRYDALKNETIQRKISELQGLSNAMTEEQKRLEERYLILGRGQK